MDRTILKEKINESSTKTAKLERLFKILGLKENGVESRSANNYPSRKKSVKNLTELAYHQVSKMKKSELDICYAEFIWPRKLKEWLEKKPIIDNHIQEVVEISLSQEADHMLSSSYKPNVWFYYPNFSNNRKQLEK